MNALKAVGLTRRYGPVAALADVDVEAPSGSITCILGPSGSGKSTLSRLLHLLEAPDSGHIEVEGKRISSPSLALLRRFSLVQQRPGLLRMSALENAMFPLRARGVSRPDAARVAKGWLERLGLSARAEARQHELSGGEVQRLAITRALVTDPDFLLIDEGTNQLDPRNVRLVEAIIQQQAARGSCVVMVTHNVPQALRMADRFVFLDQGRVAESGPREVLRAPSTKSLRLFLET